MPIHDLVKYGKIAEVVTMLSENPTLIDLPRPIILGHKSQRTPIHIAASTANVAMVRELSKFKPNISIADAKGRTPLDTIIKKTINDDKNLNDKLEIIKILINQCHANINYINPNNKSSYLRLAVQQQNYKLAQLLLNLGANCQLIDLHKSNPLDIVANPINNIPSEWWGLLLDYGAGINIDFAKFKMSDNAENNIALLTEVTKNKVVIGATWQGKLITRETPGFKFAITNFNELLEALQNKVTLNQKALTQTVTKYIGHSKKNEDLRKMVRHFRLHNADVSSLKDIVAASIRFHKMCTIEQLGRLPIELREYMLTVDTSIVERKESKQLVKTKCECITPPLHLLPNAKCI